MKEELLVFDREKHICYSDMAKNVIMEHIRQHVPESEVDNRWEAVQRNYVEFLATLPYLGGKKCTHNGPGGTYDCIAIFAYYEAMDKTPTIAELEEMNNTIFLPPFRRLGKIVNINNKLLQRLMNNVFKMCAKSDKKLESTCPTGYVMHVEPYDKKLGIRYRFTRCPIAEFAKAHGYTDIMPAFCNGDYPAMQAIHGDLIRSKTCSNANYCDYWIVGDKSPHLKEYPAKVDEAGYIKNDIIDIK